MTISKISIVASLAIVMAACGSSKKSSPKPSIVPGEAQLTAIKAKYPDATAEQLTQGHSIYVGACTNCHKQKNIFKRTEAKWLHEIDAMSPKAKLTAAQKDALTKYILSKKATQPVESK